MNDIRSFVTGTPWQDSEKDLPKYIRLWNRHHQPSLFERTSTSYVLEKGLKRVGLIDSGQVNVNDEFEVLEPTRDDYERSRIRFINGSEAFLKSARQFQAIVNSDGAAFILAIQPILHRSDVNKKLSLREKKFDAIMSHQADFPAAKLVNRFFFGDYLVAKCNEQLQGPGVRVVDCNHELRQVGSDVEVFTDYCHLTFEGNALIGEVLCDAYCKLQEND